MNNDIERIDFWKREISSKLTEKDLEQAFEAGRKKFMDKLYTYDTFYDYKKSLVKKVKD
jgi:hypothetical protein